MNTQKPTIKLSNKVNIYGEFDVFKMKYESDYYTHSTEIDFYNYLILLKGVYTKFISEQKPITIKLGLKIDAKNKTDGQVFKIENNNLDVTVDPNDEVYKLIFQQSAILKFIEIEIAKENERLKMPKMLISPIVDEPENDYSDTIPLERMILLEKLGVIKYIQSLQFDDRNEKKTAEILSSICGINSGTIAKNLGVMLGSKKNDKDGNSPYKNPKNLQLAQKKLDKFPINETKILT